MRKTMHMNDLFKVKLIVAMAFSSSHGFAQATLDSFFSDVPRNVTVRDVECSINDREVEPWRLDSYHIIKDRMTGEWGVKLIVDGSVLTRKISERYGPYVITQTSEEKRLDVDFLQGSDMVLRYMRSHLELTLLYSEPQFPGEDLVRKCVYR